MKRGAALIPQVFAQRTAFEVKVEQEPINPTGLLAQVSAHFRKLRQLSRSPLSMVKGSQVQILSARPKTRL